MQTSQGLDEQETREVMDIILGFFRKQTGSQMQAQSMLQKISQLITQQAAKLVHFGNTVFLVLVKEPGVVEVHTMSHDESSAALAQHFVKLTDMLKNMGVKKAYTYTDDPKLALVAKRTRLPFRTTKTRGEDGKTYTVYTLEFA